MLAQVPVSAILLDLIMPEMDGFELLFRMKEELRLAQYPRAGADRQGSDR
jgi:CheY-like chemotaxis protein